MSKRPKRLCRLNFEYVIALLEAVEAQRSYFAATPNIFGFSRNPISPHLTETRLKESCSNLKTESNVT